MAKRRKKRRTTKKPRRRRSPPGGGASRARTGARKRKPKRSRSVRSRKKPAKRARPKVTKTGHSKRTRGIGPKQVRALARRFSKALKERGKKQTARRDRIEKRARGEIERYIKKYYSSWERGRGGKPPSESEMRALKSRVQPQTAVRKRAKKEFWRDLTWDKKKRRWRDRKTKKTYTRSQLQNRWERLERRRTLDFIQKITGVTRREASALYDTFGGFPAGDFRRTPRWYERAEPE